MTIDLLGVADQLYGLPPTGFTAARDEAAARARLDGRPELARQIGALRRPVAAAWVVNLLVRRKQAEVERLFAIADRLREAERTGEGAELRELNRAAQAVVPAVVRMAADLARSAGRPMTEAVAGQVHQTLRAAMADPGAAAAVLSGRMVGPLEATGGTAVDVSGAVAIPTSVTSLAARAGRRADGTGRRDGAVDDPAEEGHDATATDQAAADRAAAEHRRHERRRLGDVLVDRRDRLARATTELAEASTALAAARAAADDLDTNREETGRSLREARARVRSLEDDLERLDAERAAADRSRRTVEDRAARAQRRADQAADEVSVVQRELDSLGDG
jgi:hypothetical protein